MKNFFKNTQVKVNHRITLAVLLTLIGLAFVSYSIINEKLSVLKADRALNHLASLGVHANDLVHELQVERGLSAIFLGSKGKKHKKELKVQRVQTHKARKVFENELASLSPEDKELTSDLFDQKVKIAQSFLQNIESIQKRIDSHKASSTVSPSTFVFRMVDSSEKRESLRMKKSSPTM